MQHKLNVKNGDNQKKCIISNNRTDTVVIRRELESKFMLSNH